MTDVGVRCEGGGPAGWTCTVVIREDGRERSTHLVRVPVADLDRLAPDAPDPGQLVEQSFAFLLEREPPESILRTFELAVIGRYFPEYEPEIRRRMLERR